jgi:RNA polymerase sigma-70 factor (ECF subfamily)
VDSAVRSVSLEIARDSLTVEGIYAQHADFVWTQLHRFGVREPDLEDALQEVFVVVHRRLAEFDGRSRVTTWLYAIAMRVARTQWRKRNRSAVEPTVAEEDVGESPESAALERERRRVLDHVLDQLDLEKRAVLVMFEVDEMTCEEISALVGVPLGTVYSRLHAARKAFAAALARFQKRERGGLR